MNKAAIQKLKAVLHRRRLAGRLPELERELMALAKSGCDRLGGYKLVIEAGELRLEKLPSVNGKQLELHLTWRSAKLSAGESSAEPQGGDRDGSGA